MRRERPMTTEAMAERSEEQAHSLFRKFAAGRAQETQEAWEAFLHAEGGLPATRGRLWR